MSILFNFEGIYCLKFNPQHLESSGFLGEIGGLDSLLSMVRRVLATIQSFIAQVWPGIETCMDLIQLIQCHGSLILPVPS